MLKPAECLIFSVLLAAASSAWAERFSTFGDYTIHYNALSTEVLSPDIARTYGIARSTNRGMVNIAILKKVMGTTGQPAQAAVKVTATNLNAQLRSIDMREVREQGAIYYIGEFPITDAETLRFTVEVKPEGEPAPFTAQFEQQFFVP